MGNSIENGPDLEKIVKKEKEKKKNENTEEENDLKKEDIESTEENQELTIDEIAASRQTLIEELGIKEEEGMSEEEVANKVTDKLAEGNPNILKELRKGKVGKALRTLVLGVGILAAGTSFEGFLNKAKTATPEGQKTEQTFNENEKRISSFRGEIIDQIKEAKNLEEEGANDYLNSIFGSIKNKFDLSGRYAECFIKWFNEKQIEKGQSSNYKKAAETLVYFVEGEKDIKDVLNLFEEEAISRKNLEFRDMTDSDDPKTINASFAYNKNEFMGIKFSGRMLPSYYFLKENLMDSVKKKYLDRRYPELSNAEKEYAFKRTMKVTAWYVESHVKTLKMLEKQGQGDTPEANYLKNSINKKLEGLKENFPGLVKEGINDYSDLLENVDVTYRAASLVEFNLAIKELISEGLISSDNDILQSEDVEHLNDLKNKIENILSEKSDESEKKIGYRGVLEEINRKIDQLEER
ncbi:MAG: hypothetical protein U5L76_02920 [Patescibacteria group bacterium]|nr:hypothetical protein [Patescibacteria group bacterium]